MQTRSVEAMLSPTPRMVSGELLAPGSRKSLDTSNLIHISFGDDQMTLHVPMA
jgi:hypothetical protein